MACKYKLKDSDQWFKSKEALATHLNKTPTLVETTARFQKEVGGEDLDQVQEWVNKNISEQIQEPTQQEIINDVKNKNFTTVEYESEKDIPDVWKDKVSSSGTTNGKKLFKITLPTIQFEYESRTGVSKSINEYPETRNEAVPSTDIVSNGEVQPIVTEGEAGEQGEGVQPADDLASGEGEVAVVEEPISNTEVINQSNEAKKTEVTATTEGGENMREANSQEPNEIFTQVDDAINKTGVEATAARRELKEKFGTDNYQKAIKITREFEKIITRLEAEGKITKKCP